MQEKKLICFKRLLVLILSSVHTYVYAVDVGSDLAVSVESQYTFLASSTVDHYIKSFAWMKSGFILEDATTSCTFESVFPVGGLVNLNGGTIYLNTDLCFNEMSTLKNTGTIVSMQAQTVDLAPTMTHFANATFTTILDDISLNMHYDLTLEGTVVIKNDVTINGNNHVLDLGRGAIFVKEGSIVRFHNVSLVGIAQSNISCEAPNSSIILKDTLWYQDANTFTFTQGSMQFKNIVSFIGTATFNYASSMTSTLARNSSLRFADSMHLYVGRTAVDGLEPLYFEDPNSALFFDNGYFHITEHGIRLTRGSLLIAGELEVDVAGTTSVTGLLLGDTTEEDDLRIELLPGSHTKFLNGYVGLHFANQNNFTAQAPSTKITRKLANTFSLFSDVTLKNMTVEAEIGAPLVTVSGKNLYYDNVTAVIGKTALDITGHRYNYYTNILDGNDELFLTKGTLAAYTRIAGNNNYLRGSGSISGLVYLTGTDAKLYTDFDGNINKSIQLNGGSLELARNLNCAYDAVIVGTGTIYLNNNTWYLGTSPCSWDQILTISGALGVIQCNADLTINSVITFSGSTVLEGRYNRLILGASGEIIVQPGSTLTLRNFTIEGLEGNKIRCADATATIVHENTRCILDATYSATVGAMHIQERVEFTGTETFVYQSSTPMLIANESELLIKSIGFEAQKASIDGAEPFIFENETGMLHLKNASFASGMYGMNFLKGKLILENDVTFYLYSTSTVDSFVLGDLTEANDPQWIFLPGAVVTYNPGAYTINLYDKANMVSRSNITRIYRKTGSTFYFNSDVTLPHLTIESETGSYNIVATGYGLDFKDCVLLGDGYSFDITGHRHNQYTNRLAGNNEISITKGTLPALTRVYETSNIIHGTGDVSGKITLVDQNATLTIALNGSVYKSIEMNNGTLAITRDLNMAYNSVFTGSGTIEIQKSIVTFGLQESSWTGSLLIESTESSMRLRNKMLLSGQMIFDGDITIDGDSNILEFMSTGSCIIQPHTTVRFKNIILKNIAGNNLYATDTTSKIIFENSACILSNDYSYTTGSMTIEDEVIFSGAYTCTIASATPVVIKSYAHLIFQEGITFATGRYGSVEGSEPLSFENATAQFMIKGSNFKIMPTGITLTKGHWYINENVNIDIQSTSTVDGMMMGDGTSQNDLTITFLSGSRVNFASGHAVYNCTTPHQIESYSKNNNLKMSTGASFYIQKDCVLETLYLENEPFAVVSTATDAYLKYNNCLMEIQGELFHITGKNGIDGTLALDGNNDTIILDRGTFQIPTFIANDQNRIIGTGNIAQVLTLQDIATTVTFNIQGEILSDVNLNGGRVYCDRDLYFGAMGIFKGSGIVDLEDNTCYLSHFAQDITHTITWIGLDNSRICLQGELAFDGMWHLQGNIVVEGEFNAKISFNDNGCMTVVPSSTVTFKNVVFENVTSDHVLLTDTSCYVIFDNCTFFLASDLTCTAERVAIRGSTLYSGSYQMTFTTQSGVSVGSESSLQFAKAACCSFYTPTTIINPLTFTDDSSLLVLNEATLKLNNQVLTLLKGKTSVKGNSKIIGTGLQDIIEWGDETSDNDHSCIAKSGGVLSFDLCTYAYKNVGATSCLLDPSSVFLFQANSALSLYQTLSSLGTAIFESGGAIQRVPSASLAMPVTMRGPVSYGAL